MAKKAVAALPARFAGTNESNKFLQGFMKSWHNRFRPTRMGELFEAVELALYLEAQSAYEAAQNALVDTKLRAPFDAFIDQKLVENFDEVFNRTNVVHRFRRQDDLAQQDRPSRNLRIFREEAEHRLNAG